MTKFTSLFLAAALFIPAAYATLAQAPQIAAQPKFRRKPAMTKFYALIAACAVFAPMAMVALNQAAQIVA